MGEDIIAFKRGPFTYYVVEATGMGQGISVMVFKSGKKIADLFSGNDAGTDFRSDMLEVTSSARPRRCSRRRRRRTRSESRQVGWMPRVTSGKLPCGFAASCGSTEVDTPRHAAAPRLRPLDLKRHLFVRVSLFALIVLLLGAVVTLLEARYRVRGDIQRTGVAIRQLITEEINRNYSAYDATLAELNLDLSALKAMGQVIDFCIEMSDFHTHATYRQCFAEAVSLPAPVEAFMRRVVGDDAEFRGSIGQYQASPAGSWWSRPTTAARCWSWP
jgi:hypothetical protein